MSNSKLTSEEIIKAIKRKKDSLDDLDFDETIKVSKKELSDILKNLLDDETENAETPGKTRKDEEEDDLESGDDIDDNEEDETNEEGEDDTDEDDDCHSVGSVIGAVVGGIGGLIVGTILGTALFDD